ncbi:Uncharacterised protein [Salmonella enterica subsp. arizonae]|uniref:Uncharacterized protein n=1 Tax=Salmonella enterica subsp. arizonae TaxID=59203 RepID=A0A379T2Q7_SALER|nr:Uncharacterised protein [Salmonella enterica subsp. arizonae]
MRGGGRKGDIHWDNSEIQLPVNNDALSLAIGLYTRGRRRFTRGHSVLPGSIMLSTTDGRIDGRNGLFPEFSSYAVEIKVLLKYFK